VKKIDPTLLVGVTEIAEMAGVKRNVVSNWINRWDDFPTPVVTLAMGSAWYKPDIDRWLDEPRRVIIMRSPKRRVRA